MTPPAQPSLRPAPGQRIQVKTTSRLTYKQQQSMHLLQLSSQELSAQIQEKLETNILLEEADTAAPTEETAAAAQETAEDPVSAEPDTEAQEYEDIPQELPTDIDWQEIYDGESVPASRPAPDTEPLDFLDIATETPSLRSHLLEQLAQSPLSAADETVAEAIIHALDEHGYLGCALEEVMEPGAADADTLRRMLSFVQSMDPTGVGARDLRECLLLQLDELPADTPWLEPARSLADQHLSLMENADHKKLLRALRLQDTQELQSVLDLIRSLDPRPGWKVSETGIEYIKVDLIASLGENGNWQVELNQDLYPRLQINPYYRSLLSRDNAVALQRKERAMLKEHLSDAKWFRKMLQNRGRTLLQVGECVCERQQGFLRYGAIAMRPLILQDIAKTLGMHESTISRAISEKHMQTPHGVYALKYFFSSQLQTRNGGTCSATAVQERIRQYVAEENPAKPLSDNKITQLLRQNQGIDVARRTVAKYREFLRIPPSNERRRAAPEGI